MRDPHLSVAARGRIVAAVYQRSSRVVLAIVESNTLLHERKRFNHLAEYRERRPASVESLESLAGVGTVLRDFEQMLDVGTSACNAAGGEVAVPQSPQDWESALLRVEPLNQFASSLVDCQHLR